MFLLDTNILSEMRRIKPHGGVVAWLQRQPGHLMFVSAVSIGEIQVGIETTRKQDPTRARELDEWCSALILSSQIVPMGAEEFQEFARIMRGKSETLIYDAMIAATAKVHGMEVVSRNVADFKALGCAVINPFNFKGE